MLWRCLEVCDLPIDHGCKAGGLYHDVFTPKYSPLILTVRDFRDVALSQARIHAKDGPGILRKGIEVTKHRARLLHIMAKKNPGALVWRYEDFWRNPDKMIAWLVALTENYLTREQQEAVRAIVDPDSAKAIAGAVVPTNTDRPFMSYDRASHIHHAHIGPRNGEPGAWRNAPQKVQDILNRSLSKELKEWGYET